MDIRVTVWNEFRHERSDSGNAKIIREIYPDGMHITIKKGLEALGGVVARTATLDDEEHGLTKEVLHNTDVLIWWGHVAHGEVSDEIVTRIQKRVLEGMGLIVLHSGHFSKIFQRLMGTHCSLKWREKGELERIWVVMPNHPIAHGLGEYFELPNTEMYGERFDIPQPDELVFISWFEGGEVFRSGCCWNRGAGKVFYFRPGHETYPIFHNPTVMRVIHNAVMWASPSVYAPFACPNVKELMPIKNRDVDIMFVPKE